MTPGEATFDAAALAKHLLRSVKAGGLATLEEATGHPFVTLANFATDYDGSPIMLTSDLSAHTRNMKADARVSLLLARGGKGDPLAHPRLSVLGQALQERDPDRRGRLKARFLARHPKSSLYADFADFSFWRIAVARAHLNGGFAKAADLCAVDVLTEIAEAQEVIDAETSALAHLNADHAESLALYAVKLAGARSAHWRATGLDPDGLDLGAGDLTARIVFPKRVTTSAGLRRVLVELAVLARAT